MSVTENPARRRWLMTGILWAVFAACISAAALLAHFKTGLWRIDLTEPQTIGGVEVSLPRNWQVSARRGEIKVIEGRPPGRILTIHTINAQDVETLLTQLDPADVRKQEDLDIPGGNGAIIHPRRGMPLALLVFDDGRALAIQLSGRGQPTAEDDTLIYHIAKSVHLNDEPNAPELPQHRTDPSHEI